MNRRLAGLALLVLLLWLLGGRVGLLVGLAIAAWDWFLRPSPATLLRAALLGFCLLPLTVLLRGLPTKTTVTPLFAGSNLIAHYLAGTALALLVLGILRDVRPAPLASGPGNGPPPPGTAELLAPLPPPPAKELPARPDDAGTDGNGARELRPPALALPGVTHPPLWDPARRGRSGGEGQPAGDEQPGTESAPAAPPAVHPPLWDPARRRRPGGAGSEAERPAGDAGQAPPPAKEGRKRPRERRLPRRAAPPSDEQRVTPERPSLGPLTGAPPEQAGAPPDPEGEPEAGR